MVSKANNSTRKPGIPSVVKIILLIMVVFMAAGVLYISVVRPNAVLKNGSRSDDSAVAGDSLPVLVDLGADRCVPCKMMAPILEELKKEYKGELNIIFLDVWKDPKLGREYRIFTIPTQIFFDENGRELYRHIGYYSREEILKKWKELGYEFR